MKIYTKTGDDGTTGIQGNIRTSKSDYRIVAYGSVDEINASVGVALTEKADADIKSTLTRIQNELFTLGADLSNPNLEDGSNRMTEDMVTRLESEIDAFESELEPLTNFILPGGTRLASGIHLSRTITRRAEINAVKLQQVEKINPCCVQYLNRLSDLLFVAARVVNQRNGIPDTVWKSQK